MILWMMVTSLSWWWHHCHDGDIIVTVKSVVLIITADVSASNSTRENAKIIHIWISKLSSINNAPNAGSDDDFVWQQSYYLNQQWRIIDLTPWNKFKWNFNQNTNIFMLENAFDDVVCNISAILSQPRRIKNVFFFFNFFGNHELWTKFVNQMPSFTRGLFDHSENRSVKYQHFSVNSLWCSDAKWICKSGSSVGWVMACCPIKSLLEPMMACYSLNPQEHCMLWIIQVIWKCCHISQGPMS